MQWILKSRFLAVFALAIIYSSAGYSAEMVTSPKGGEKVDIIVLERGDNGKLQVRTEELKPASEKVQQQQTKKLPKLNASAENTLLDKPLNLQTILLDKPTREKIDRQRAAYINPPQAKEVEIIPPPPPPGKGTAKKKVVKKRIYLPYKLAVSAVVMKPNGDSLVRINGKYNNTSSKHITINKQQTSPNGVALDVLGKQEIVPVGTTLLPRKLKVLPTYQLEKKARKKVLPKTKQAVAKDTLKQVQIITNSKQQK